jgi:hypothetical protein
VVESISARSHAGCKRDTTSFSAKRFHPASSILHQMLVMLKSGRNVAKSQEPGTRLSMTVDSPVDTEFERI